MLDIVLEVPYYVLIDNRKEVKSMTDVKEMVISKDEKEDIKKLVSMLLILSKEDRAILLSNANAFKARRDIEVARESDRKENKK